MTKKIWVITVARTKEFYRDHAGLMWNLLFPVLLIFGFTLFFTDDSKPEFRVALFPKETVTRDHKYPFLKTKHIDFIALDDTTQAIKKVQTHTYDIFILESNDGLHYWINDYSSKGYFIEKILFDDFEGKVTKKTIHGEKITYADWVIPGILAMNMMLSGLWGIGWTIVRYRKTGYLKRLRATPIAVYEFLIGNMISRMAVIILSVIIVFIGTYLTIDFPLNGSPFLLLLILIMGTLSTVSAGLIIAARFTNEELVGGLLNFVSWPMIFLSEVWFPLDEAHPAVKACTDIIPLTHAVRAARAVMIDGAGITEIYPALLFLGASSIVFVIIGSLIFKWE